MKKNFITGRNATVPAKSQKFILKKKYCKEQNLLKQWKANFPKSQAVDLRCRKRYRYRWIWFQLTSQGKNWNSWRNSLCYCIPLGLWNWRSVLLWKRALAIFKDRMTISMDPIFFCVCLPNDQQSLLRLLSSVSLRHEADFTKENTYHFCRPRTSEQCYRPFITVVLYFL